MLDQIADYELERLLGKGGMGAVYLSHHPLLNIPLAIKILEPHNSLDEEEFQQRFIREGLLAASIEHHNLVRIYDAGADGPRNYLAMEYIDGPNLGKLIEQSPDGLDESFVRESAIGICGALKLAHSKGIIHRDIKPENILMTPSGEAKLADLGIAKDEASELNVTATGIALGTPHYIAPEQALDAASADNRSDIYTLGATLYHLLCGSTPYEGKSPLEVMMKHVQEPLTHPIIRRPNINADFANVIAKMMEKRPEMRYQNCDEVIKDLEKLKTGKALVHLKEMYEQEPETKTKVIKKPSGVHKKKTVKKAPQSTTPPVKSIIAGIAALIVLGLISLALIPEDQKTPPVASKKNHEIIQPESNFPATPAAKEKLQSTNFKTKEAPKKKTQNSSLPELTAPPPSLQKLEDELELALRKLMQRNKLTQLSANNYQIKDGLINLDLSNQIYLKDISPIAHFKFGELDLSGTSVHNIGQLKNVKHLNLSNTETHLGSLRNVNIERLELGIVSDLHSLNGANIRELKMMHFSGPSLHALKELPELRRLIITNGAPKVTPKKYIDVNMMRLRELVYNGAIKKGPGGKLHGDGMRKGPGIKFRNEGTNEESDSEDFRRRPPLKPERNFPR